MPERDKTQQDQRSAVVAPDTVGGKHAAGPGPDGGCGDAGLRIGRDGTWYYQGSAIQRKPLVKLFASVLRREDDQHYFLVTPVEKVPIEVEDAPFLAVTMQIEGEGHDQRLHFRTSLDEAVTAGSAHPLTFRGEKDGSFTPFILVREGLEAKITRAVYYELVTVTCEEPSGETGVWSGGTFFAFPMPAPGA